MRRMAHLVDCIAVNDVMLTFDWQQRVRVEFTSVRNKELHPISFNDLNANGRKKSEISSLFRHIKGPQRSATKSSVNGRLNDRTI